MYRLKTPAMLLGATALTVPLAFAPASAQQQQEIGAEGACEQLYQLVQQSEEASEELLEEFQEAPGVAETNEAEACVLMIERVETAGGITAQAQERGQGAQVITETESFTATDTVRQTVEIEQQAIVEGQVTVRQPIPEIDIQQGGAQVEVSEGAVDVAIEEQPAEIMIRQPAANVRVEIPQPTITIEQPAPEIVITMPPPGVSLDQQPPQVSVNMPDPTVSVAQADPEVSADVQARFVGAEELTQIEQQGQGALVTTQTERLDATGSPVDAEKQAEVTFQKGEAEVVVQKTADQGEVSYQSADPRVVYEPADPQVEVTFAENAQVQVQQIGEPMVSIQRQEGGQQPQQEQEQPQQQGQVEQDQANLVADVAAVEEEVEAEREIERMTPEDTSRFLGIDQTAEAIEAEIMQVTAADLEGRDVLTVRGEDVGEIEGIFSNGGQLYAVVEHGGFLGIGDSEVAIPASRLAMQGDDVILMGLTEEQLEQLPEYDFDAAERIGATDPVEIGLYD